MSSKFCINGTAPPETSSDFESILINMDAAKIALGVFLILGGVASTLPQHIKIIKTKSVLGLSYLWMFLGNVNQFSAVMNAFVLKYPQIKACSVLGVAACTPSLLSLYQLFALWVFTFPLYILFLIFSPRDIASISKENPQDIASAQKEYKISKFFFLGLLAFLLIIPMVMAITIAHTGMCSSATYSLGYAMGILSTIITFVQWSPQIYKTIRAKSVGSFSIAMLCIQGPGTLIILYFLIFVSKESISTWLSYLSALVQIIVLLVLLIYYDRRNKKIQKEIEDAEKTDSFGSSPNGSQVYSDTDPLLSHKLMPVDTNIATTMVRSDSLDEAYFNNSQISTSITNTSILRDHDDYDDI
ncbi:hypothetical protein CYY_001407 [Polysphondylium violaceum]|uniref:PQ-loop repeat-containing protein n=1 Tax=Polysphondylium violaceum TaxID=133409 RepID=A0A8J4V7Y8_9MYCE|nr:hypothetical protein CYY_001407 [Polysphondylium violaceum]